MRTLSSGTTSAVAATVTTPGYLIQIEFAAPAHFCSRGSVVWDSTTWVGYDVRIAGLDVDGSKSSAGGTLTFNNADLTMSAFILAEGVSGRPVRIWKFYGESATLDLAAPVLIFSGICDTATIDDQGRAAIAVEQASRTTYCPRSYINAANGFNFVPAENQLLTWGNDTVRLTAEGY